MQLKRAVIDPYIYLTGKTGTFKKTIFFKVDPHFHQEECCETMIANNVWKCMM